MMRLVCVVLACFFLAASPPAISRQSAETAIRSAYAALRTAELKNDATALSGILASNFAQRNADGSLEARDAYVKDETQNAPGLTVSSLNLVITHLVVHGGDARARAAENNARGLYLQRHVRKQ
jgi:hypothetical protein